MALLELGYLAAYQGRYARAEKALEPESAKANLMHEAFPARSRSPIRRLAR